MKTTGLEWNWKNSLNIIDLAALCSSLGRFQPTTVGDKWSCELSGDGTYHIDIIRHMIDWPKNPIPQVKVDWINEIPIKVLHFIWRANLGRIPTAT